jgi:hypothetical protein
MLNADQSYTNKFSFSSDRNYSYLMKLLINNFGNGLGSMSMIGSN